MKQNRQVLLLGALDILINYIILIMILLIRYGSDDFIYFIRIHIIPFSILFLLWSIIFAIFNLHEIGVHPRMISIALIACFFVGGLFFYIFPWFSITPKTNLVLMTILFGIFASFTRIAIFSIQIRRGKKRSIILSGLTKHSKEILLDILKNNHLGYRVDALFLHKGDSIPEDIPTTIPILTNTKELIDFSKKTNVHAIVYTTLEDSNLYTAYYTLLSHGVYFYHAANFWEEYKETIPIYETDHLWYIQNLPSLQSRIVHAVKRIMDITLAVLLLPFVLMALLLFAPFLRGVKKNPIFFVQTRVGKNEKSFRIVKFRTMIPDAEKDGPRWAQANDARITRLGMFMRKARIDELPQVFNVLRGDMSFIGPRPERPEFVDNLSKTIPHYHLRHMVRPGITGWAQVKYKYGASIEDAAIKLMHDLYYIKNPSLVLEVRIVFKTIATMLTGKGN